MAEERWNLRWSVPCETLSQYVCEREISSGGRTDRKASSMSGVLYSSRISSLVQSKRGPVALTASLSTLLAEAGGGGGALGEKVESLMGVLKGRTDVDQHWDERAAARREKRLNAMTKQTTTTKVESGGTEVGRRSRGQGSIASRRMSRGN